MNAFSYLLDGMNEFDILAEHIKRQNGPVHTVGVSGSQKSHLIYCVGEHTTGKVLVIAADEKEAGRTVRELSFLSCDEVLYFPPREYILYDVDTTNRKSELERLKSISQIDGAKFVVTTVAAVLSYTVPREIFGGLSFTLSSGDEYDLSELSVRLADMGYSRVSKVEALGQYSVRGSIVDIYPPSSDYPFRIEFWGDEVDSIRYFDVQTQLSQNAPESAFICPARELVYTKDTASEIAGMIRRMKNENLLRDIEKFTQNRYFASNDRYMPFIYDRICTVFDYLDKDCCVILDEPKEIKSRSDIWCTEQGEIISSMMEKGLFPKCQKPYFLEYSDMVLICRGYFVISASSLSHSVPDILPVEIVSFASRTLQAYTQKAEFLVDDILHWHSTGYRIIALMSNDIKINNLRDMLFDKGIVASIHDIADNSPDFGEIFIIKGSLERGFEYPSIKTVVVTDGEQSVKAKRKFKAENSKDIIKSFEELSPGDYVVHRSHGIGQYVGINQLEVQGVIRDYIKLRYKGTDNLYVPIDQLNLLYRYSGSEHANVTLNSLGGTAWHRTVTKVKTSVSHLAEDMIRLYAERSRIPGHIYPRDTQWQKQFENDFFYDETPDQLKCINEVKTDMEQGKCMDRLLCGDVGYGKTEVALRAAFKCVMDGMQVAYLVPTTILANQHYNTFLSRMKEYCVNVEMLSRFRSPKQQKEIISRLKRGDIDVVIGTHRLLQKDVEFKSLGMLIIDEEQRFGVAHKEKLKEIKKNVNVLTLSATPIPRTLNMAMIGIRDLSVIASPPGDRYPVQTFVMEYNDTIVRSAMERELARNGQVYYLYNRIDGIERAAQKIQNLVPDARVAVAHGRMSESHLESIMENLISGEIDVLVCTTIIETGLDVSNVNTIIIENADRLGLSQLYQLKGRVGRSNRLSYAYFTYHEGKILDSVAQKRLQAIREFTEFGSGFKIALRDLEIRGAGNLLGREQHGNMNLVGYDMYCLLLEQAVKELKGEKAETKPETSLDIKVSAFIPDECIANEMERIDMYRKIAAIETEDDKCDVADEFIDRYGDIPESTDNLMELSLVRTLASRMFISDITQKDGMVIFTFDKIEDIRSIVEILDEYKKDMVFSSGDVSYLKYKYNTDVLNNIKIILQKMANTIQETSK